MKIESFTFGTMVIDGRVYRSDLIIYPDGRVEDGWRRRRGHGLCEEDMAGLITTEPEVIVAGTGVSGMVEPNRGLEKGLLQKGIRFLAVPNEKAVVLFNELNPGKRVGACFHLTC